MKSGKHSKAQVSVELLVTLGVVLAFALPVLLLLLSISQFGFENASVAQAEGAAKKLADNINEVHAQGGITKRVVLMSLPLNTESLSVGENEVVVKVKISAGEYEAVSPMFGKVKAFELKQKSGPISLVLQNNGNEVEISG